MSKNKKNNDSTPKTKTTSRVSSPDGEATSTKKTKSMTSRAARKPSAPMMAKRKAQTDSVAPTSVADAQHGAETTSVSADQRHSMISLAAYYRAVERGFQSGFEVIDWLAAETDIDATLARGASAFSNEA